MCDCGCITSTDDASTYEPSTYDITGNPIDYTTTYDLNDHVPVEATPVYQAPAEVTPVEVAPVTYDPGTTTNDQLLNSLNTLPAGSATADAITNVLLQPGKDAAKWFEPTHDIYGNSL